MLRSLVAGRGGGESAILIRHKKKTKLQQRFLPCWKLACFRLWCAPVLRLICLVFVSDSPCLSVCAYWAYLPHIWYLVTRQISRHLERFSELFSRQRRESENAEQRVYGKFPTRSSLKPPFSLCAPPWFWKKSSLTFIPGGLLSDHPCDTVSPRSPRGSAMPPTFPRTR